MPELFSVFRFRSFLIFAETQNDSILNSCFTNSTTEIVSNVESDAYTRALNEFIGFAAESIGNHEMKLIIVFQPQLGIDDEGNAYVREDFDAIKQFNIACENNNVIFLDLSDAFLDMYQHTHLLPHGFINTGIGSGHLNRYGYEVLTDSVMNVIERDKK